MCFDDDSRPPIPPIAGGALDGTRLTLDASDGNRLNAYLARAAEPTGTAIVVFPDVRGLHPYYEDLALRFAEHGIDAIAFDYFGRTAGLGERGGGFEHQEHARQVGYAGVRADATAAVEHLRAAAEPQRLFSIGFCFGGRMAFLSSVFGFGLGGAIGFYGFPTGARADIPAPAEVASSFGNPVLGIFGGADEGITQGAIETFAASLDRAGIEHTLTTYPGAPHGFFDRKADEFTKSSEAAWQQVLDFIRAHSTGTED